MTAATIASRIHPVRTSSTQWTPNARRERPITRAPTQADDERQRHRESRRPGGVSRGEGVVGRLHQPLFGWGTFTPDEPLEHVTRQVGGQHRGTANAVGSVSKEKTPHEGASISGI